MKSIKGIVREEVVPAWKGELNLAVMHLGDQGTSALASRHNLAPNDLEKVENVILTIGATWNLLIKLLKKD